MDLIYDDSIACLQQGVRLLIDIPAETYTFQSEDTLNSTVGGHFRHNIDHYISFLSGLDEGRVDYDARARNPKVENNPESARHCIEKIVRDLEALPASILDAPLLVKMDSGAGTEPWSHSTARRELQFLLSHTVHHYALIAIICRMLGTATPVDFGVAPSTLKHRERASTACAL